MPETILVVDDDPDIARFVEVNLRSAGYDVSVAADGEEALDKAAGLRPDLVLLDVMMPRIDGFEVAQRLRKNPQTSNTSIIMLTAKALSADKVTGLQSGADDYIIKPFDPIELLARVKQDPDLCHIPVIVLTSSTRESDVRTCYGLHASCYLNKPGEFRQLAAMMKAIHDFWLLLVELPGRA